MHADHLVEIGCDLVGVMHIEMEMNSCCTTYEGCVCVPWLYWLLMGLSSSLRARLFEWISSFTKADSGDDHVPLYSKGSQPPSSQ